MLVRWGRMGHKRNWIKDGIRNSVWRGKEEKA